MKRQYLFNLAFLSLVILSLSAGRAQAQTAKDELNYSASICTPRNAGQFDGSDRAGLAWDSRGFWVNKDTDESQQLICPIPFDPRAVRADGTFGTIEVRVNVFDNSHLHEVVAKVFGVATSNDPFNNNQPLQPLATAFTSNETTGARTLLLSVRPGNDIRYLWLEIDVPREVWPAKRSAVIGYRVNRVGFN